MTPMKTVSCAVPSGGASSVPRRNWQRQTKKLEQAKQELATERDKYLRMLAEYDNFRRRTAKGKGRHLHRRLHGRCRELLPSWTRWSVPWRIYPGKAG